MKTSANLTGYPSVDRPWLKYYSEEAINTPLPRSTIYGYFYESNKDYPDDIAIEYLGKKIKYGELFENIDKTAAAFQALDVKPGEIVTVALPSVPEAIYAVYALNKIGAVADMIHPLAGKEEILHYLNEAESRVAVVFDGTHDILRESIKDTSVEHAVIVSAGISLPSGVRLFYKLKNRKKYVDNGIYQTWKEFIRRGAGTEQNAIDKDPLALAIISHTGGTTGEPKGVMCSDININALMHQIVCNFKYERQGVSLAVLPPFINYSLIEAMMAMLAIGYKVVLIPDYRPEKIGEYIGKYRPNIILSIPAYWDALLSIDDSKLPDMSCLEQIYAGGEAMDAEHEQAINKVLEAHGSHTPLLKGFGSTEMTGGATQTYSHCNSSGSVGIPLVKVNCSVINTVSGAELQYNEEGEICFSGATVMMGYYNKPDDTDAIIKIHADGQRWFHTGDLGYITEDGIVFITGRIKRIFITKGSDGVATKMFPDRIESVVNKHPSVSLSCVISVPDKERINYPKAIIELKEGNAPSKELKADIIRFCKGKLPEYQIPDEIDFIDVLPRTDRGKVDYKVLEDRAGRTDIHDIDHQAAFL